MDNTDFVNYPPNGVEGKLKQLGLGFGGTGIILIEMVPHEDESVDTTITVSAGLENDIAVETTAEVFEGLAELLRDSLESTEENK